MTLHRKMNPSISRLANVLLMFGAVAMLAESGVTISEAGVPPAPAAAVGYNTLAFGPGVGIGTNWFLFSFYGLHGGLAVQNSNGSLFLPGNAGDNPYGICTAAQTKDGKTWTGTAFGGG